MHFSSQGWGDGSADKSICCSRTRTWVQIPTTNIKSQTWLYTCKLQCRQGWGRVRAGGEAERLLRFAGHQPNFRSSERPCCKGLRWRVIKQDTQHLWSLCTTVCRHPHIKKKQKLVFIPGRASVLFPHLVPHLLNRFTGSTYSVLDTHLLPDKP